MKRYKYVGDSEAFVPDLNAVVKPGEVVETDEKLSGAFEPVKDRDDPKD